eukprot:CAMPEP_0168740028 /NCGR_PEP_ID=MMETSP0724-20121128/11765_1 /TAXON_ID=265536 /ORGANISM="Amphiprora sp., Strain CCMP467" /LENGTH=446 /DNA_ID=CAMNT_0008787445 /DNA_START=25 /DNA_END=1365 /DNA_ORIENTATION=-
MTEPQSSSSDSSALQSLESDARHSVLQFLSCFDLVHGYALTCQDHWYHDVLQVELPRRRRVQFFGTLATAVATDSASSRSAASDDDEMADPRTTTTTTTNFPNWSQYQRLERLHRILPSRHPLETELRDLVQDLKNPPPSPSPQQQQQQQPTDDDNSQNFAQRFQHWQRGTRALRLYSSLIRRCTTELLQRQQPTERGCYRMSLEHYMGYVVACYMLLLSDDDDDNPREKWNEDRWISHLVPLLQGQLSDDHEHNVAGVWCQACIWLHSLFLHVTGLGPQLLQLTAPLQQAQQQQTQQQHEQAEPRPPNALVPASWASVSSLPRVGRHHEILSPLEMYVNHNSRCWFHRTTANQFGPLGPAFRGRDRVETVASRRISLIIYNLCNTEKMLEFKGEEWNNLHLGQWEDLMSVREELKEWTRNLWQLCNTTRPMTVQPPMVSIQHLRY